MKNYLSNAFSLQMLDEAGKFTLSTTPCRPADVPADAISAIGHTDTAAVVSHVLGRPVAANRINVTLEDGDVLYVAQLRGGRLPEGATALPEGFKLTFVRVHVTRDTCDEL